MVEKSKDFEFHSAERLRIMSTPELLSLRYSSLNKSSLIFGLQ